MTDEHQKQGTEGQAEEADKQAPTQPAVPPPAITISRGEDRVMKPTGELPAAVSRHRQPLQIRIRVPVPAPEEVAEAEAAAAAEEAGPAVAAARPG